MPWPVLPTAKAGPRPTPGSYLSLNLKKSLKFTSPTFASLPMLSGPTGLGATRQAAQGEHIVPLTEPEAGQPSSQVASVPSDGSARPPAP